MFQYAAGRALSITTDQPHRMDISDFSNYALHHGYELSQVFNVHGKCAEVSDVCDLLGWRARYPAKRLLRRKQLAWLRSGQYVVEPHFHYWPGFQKLKGDCYLSGYWQSERYFNSVLDLIRKEFTFREPLVGQNHKLAKEISACQAVSLHVRRGDYVSDRKTSQVMEVCSEVYYREAIAYMAERVEHPVFYVFSDDMAWAKQNLHLASPSVFVEHNFGVESYRDMQLMSLCQHHIIANSSFSWWGAWLNGRTGKMVVAPRNWFAKPIDTRDLIPQSWCRL